MTVDDVTSYDITLYPDLAYGQTHPDRRAVLGKLFGLRPAFVATCRVLEIGCAAGGNCLSVAAGLPQAAFAGALMPRRSGAHSRDVVTTDSLMLASNYI